MAPLGLGVGFYGLGPTINAGEAVHVNDVDGNYVLVPTGEGNGVMILDGFQSTFRGSWTFSTYFYGGNNSNFSKAYSHLFSTQGDDTDDRIQLLVSPGFEVTLYVEANNDPVAFTTSAGAAGLGPTTTGWHHMLVTCTKNSSANTTAKIYIDGSEITTTASGALSDTNHNLYDQRSSDDFIVIGNRYDTDGNVRAWLMKHTAIWSVALDAANIAEIYGAGINTPLDLTSASGNYDQQANLVGYWKFTDGAGTTAVDETGNNNGTLKIDTIFL